ncbi:MAG: helix-turn-helix domain-containing protein [Lachnospiraceae bacterium]|nr:helix-turn-helix domain-containing protein [Lachnospiraceae bacterium]
MKNEKALLNVNEFCEYLGIGKTKARELLSDTKNGFTVRIGYRLYAHKERLDEWLLSQIL